MIEYQQYDLADYSILSLTYKRKTLWQTFVEANLYSKGCMIETSLTLDPVYIAQKCKLD